MAAAFKHLINAGTVHDAAFHLGRAWPDFDAPTFEALALHGLDALEFKARAMQWIPPSGPRDLHLRLMRTRAAVGLGQMRVHDRRHTMVER